MRLVFFVSGISLALAGCATGSNMAWSNPNASQQEFYQASAQCQSMAGPGGQQIAGAGAGSGAFNRGFSQTYNQVSAINAQRRQRQIFEDCMRGFGWRLVPK